MMTPIPLRPWRLPRCAPAALLVLAAACADDAAGPPTAALNPGGGGALAVLACEVSVAGGEMQCADASTGARTSLASAGGPALDQRTFGGQGTYVRLANTGNNTDGNLYSIQVTVQNLSTLAMGTADGAARHASGIQIFFGSGPETTGGTGDVTVHNPTGTAMFTAGMQPYYQYGGTLGGVDEVDLGPDGVLASRETSGAVTWQFALDPGVTRFGFTVFVRTETAPGVLATAAPQVAAVSADTLVPGATVTLSGINFHPDAASNTVRIGGVAATVTGATATTLDVVVPCISSGLVAVQVQQGGMTGVPVPRPLRVAQRTLAVGQAAILASAADVGCNELPATGAASRYVVAVYNTSGSPASTAAFQLAADPDAAPAAAAPAARPAFSFGAAASAPAQALAPGRGDDDWHLRIMEMNRRENERLRARFAGDARMRPRHNLTVNADPPALTRTIRVLNLNGGSCDSYYSVAATRVYYDGKIAIYEDDATPAGLKAAANPAMQAYYDAIGDQYNADMEPVVRNHFGDPLLRDASTDANGVLIALFTPLINNSFPGVAGFVVSCDQYPNAAGNSGSNFGEYFYAYQPTSTGTGYSPGTADYWYWTIRATFIHETKHVASQAARVAAGAPFELSWLEEGTARHAEELWARSAVYNVTWKGNTGYGSDAAPGSIYCDNRPSWATCQATDPSRPSLNLFRHFQGLHTFLRAPEDFSPFGPAAPGDASFYATSWSLVRYAIDRYGVSDAAFLTALTGSSTRGTANLAAQAGVPLEELMGGWALALYADDYPGLTGASADLQMPTWNFTSIYAGMNADFPTRFPAAYPLAPRAVALGEFGPVDVPSLRGGGVSYFELSGTHTSAQLLNLQGSGGGALPSTLRMAIARIQ